MLACLYLIRLVKMEELFKYAYNCTCELLETPHVAEYNKRNWYEKKITDSSLNLLP
jgi:hypothetical protein